MAIALTAKLPDLDRAETHAIASLLKLYLQQLPEPLLTRTLYDQFLKAAKTLRSNPEEVRFVKRVGEVESGK